MRALPVEEIRGDFPLLGREVEGKRIVYLDSAATSLKPRAVIRAVTDFYEKHTANVNRGVHFLSLEASELFDEGRSAVARFLNASPREIVFTRNATEAINLVARGLAQEDRVLHTLLEHHSNFLPWRRREGASTAVRLLHDGKLDLADFVSKLAAFRPRLVAVAHVSNAFGVVHPLEEIVRLSHQAGARVLVDGCQSVPHRPIDVKALDLDYLCFSGHKMCGPGGVGVLYGKLSHLEELAPFVFGGDMVKEVHESSFALRDVPHRFEAGTPAMEAVIGLGAACRYLERFGLASIAAHEGSLTAYALERLSRVPGLTLRGPLEPESRGSSVSFTLDGVEANGVARMLSHRFNICVRSGFHCAQPAHEALGSPPTVRASYYLYNTKAEIDLLADALDRISSQLGA